MSTENGLADSDRIERQNYAADGSRRDVSVLLQGDGDAAVLDPREPSPLTSLDRDQIQTKLDQYPRYHPVALIETLASANGAWWRSYDVDPPDWVDSRRHPAIHRSTELSELSAEDHAPDPPDSLEPGSYVSYCCNSCQDPCLNRRESEAAEARECWLCVTVPE